MADQKVNDRTIDIDGDVPMWFGRQPQYRHFLGGIKWLWNQVIGHIIPQKLLEGTDTGGRNGEFRVYGHTELTGEGTKSKRIVTTTGEVVIVQIKTSGNTRVGWGNVTVRVRDGGRATEGLG